MTTFNLNIANISFNSSLDSRDIQSEIDNIEGLKNDCEFDLEALRDEFDVIKDVEEIVAKEREIKEREYEYASYAEELEELKALKDEISNNSDEGFEYGIQLIHENDIDDYLHEMLIDCGYIPKDLPSWIEIDWDATYDNMKQDYSELELNGNTFYVR